MAKAKTKTLNKILVANRGEIARRIIQSIQEMGKVAVAVYSDVDKGLPYVLEADEAYHLPGIKPAETYLVIEKIIQLCKDNDIDGVHPGYGFLSENTAFAQACADNGITFIGPGPEVIEKMGDKIIAKETMVKADVPVVPGWAGSAETAFSVIEAEADKIGYPVLVKAAAGGGGKGMRLVEAKKELKNAWEAAGREAKNAFGDSRVFLEKYVTSPRHIEFQIFGDHHGNVVHLFERECSIQRRHQKIIEESPSPALTPELRAEMGEAAVKAAQALGYVNAGTVEFIFSDKGEFYFLEVNTRLQVEHPVTELVVQKDLVRLQIDIAEGKALPFKQEDLTQTGHAVECRIYAEDPAKNFMPSVGVLSQYHPPAGSGIRVDDGFYQGEEVTVHYDPMLSKLIVWGEDRQAALDKMSWALSHYVVLGVTTNIAYLQEVITHPVFKSGEITTHFLQDYPIEINQPDVTDDILTAAVLGGCANKVAPQSSSDSIEDASSPWQLAGSWRG